MCFSVPWITDPTTFAALRLLHGESGVLVDRTILAPDQPAPDFVTRRVCARTTSLSPFAVAVALPDTTPPVVTVPATVTIEAIAPRLGAPYTYTASAIDRVDGALTPACAPASGTTFPVGSTTVTCTATDAAGNAGSGSFVVTVTLKVAVNVAPMAYDGQFTTTARTTLAGILGATDINGDRLTFQIVANPPRGRVVVDASTGAFTYYTPHSKGTKIDGSRSASATATSGPRQLP